MNATTDLNLSECIVKASHWGFTRVHNVCSNVVVDVPWGVGDWAMTSLLVSFLVSVVAVFFVMAFMMFVMVWKDM